MRGPQDEFLFGTEKKVITKVKIEHLVEPFLKVEMSDEKAKRDYSVCWKTFVPVKLGDGDCFYFPTKDDMKSALEELRSRKIPLQRGDLVSFEKCRTIPGGKTDFYRMEALVIFDGKEIVDLEEYPDEYGSLPRTFLCFDPTDYQEPSFYYPKRRIEFEDHDDERGLREQTIWLKPGSFLEQIQQNVTPIEIEDDLGKREIFYTWFESNGKTFKIVDDFEVPNKDYNFKKVIQELTPETLICGQYEASVNGIESKFDGECIFLSEKCLPDC